MAMRKNAGYANGGNIDSPRPHRRALGVRILAWVALALGIVWSNLAPAMSLDERMDCARAVESVNWAYRIWPEVNKGPKPPLDDVFPEAAARRVAEDSVKMSQALESRYGKRIDATVLSRELLRMASHTQASEQLKAMFDAVGNDSTRAAECIARPLLARRWLMESFNSDPALRAQAQAGTSLEAPDSATDSTADTDIEPVSLDAWWRNERNRHSETMPDVAIKTALPEIANGRLGHKFGPDEWRTLVPRTPSSRAEHTMVWTGSEMIVWGGSDIDELELNSGGRYHPATDTWFGTSLVGAPPPTRNHSAVWTGTEMIVWGGNSTQFGGRYNPVSDSWTATTTVGAPSARNYHSAVWTGSVMVVWGGGAGTPYLNTGGRYDPVTDSWTPTSLVGASWGRQYHAVVWTGTEMIVWGGTVDIGGALTKTNAGLRYNPVTDSWVATPTVGAPTARDLFNGAKAIWTGSEMVIWGGADANGSSNTGARYNPDTNLWSPISTIGRPSARSNHVTVWTGTEMIVWSHSVPLSGAKYRPSTNSWAPMSSIGAPPNYGGAHAIWTGAEMIVWGGRNDPPGSQASQKIQLGGRYNALTDTWTPTSVNHPAKRREVHTATWTGTEMVIWGGGSVGSIANYSNARYHAATDTWLQASGPTAGERRHRAVSIWTGTHVIVWGGVNNSGIAQNDGVLYNPATDTWTPTSVTAAPVGRENHTMVWTGQEVVVWGGTAVGANRTDTGGRYNPFSDAWTPTSLIDAPVARKDHTAVWTGAEMIVWGGSALGIGLTNTGSRYFPTTDSWQALTLTGAPAPREWLTSVWTGTEMIVWGGVDGGTRFSSGGRYNPANGSWSATSLTGAPEPRQEHTAVWTGDEMIIWGGWRFEGGGVGSIFPSASGRYSPVTDSWTALSTANAPAGRRNHTAVWTGESMVIWGGEDVDGRLSDEFAAYYPTLSKQGTQTRLTSVSPSTSNLGEPVTVSVLVSAIATAPANGTVNVIASTGESCADASPTANWVNSSTFSCTINFATAGSRQLTASFFGSATHKDSSGPAVEHVVVVQDELFANGFE